MIEYENLQKVNSRFHTAFQEKFATFLNQGWYILGREVANFEEAFAAYCGSRHCIGVANGLDALTIALRCFSFKEGSEVIVPSNTYIATILSILNAGLRPVLVEPDLQTYNIDPAKIEENVTPRTVAIMVVHLYGKCCEMEAVMDIARRRALKVVEDCAQAHGAKFKERMAGTFGDFGAFSFYPTKNLGALGDAGSLNTDEPELATRSRLYRNYGSVKKYYNEIAGTNSRLDEVQAAFLNIKLKALDEITEHKRRLAQLYMDGLREDFIKPAVHPDYFDVYHIFNIRHRRRDELRSFLERNGIRTEIHYPVPPHRQKAMQGVLEGSFPLADEIHNTTLSLPISFGHTVEDILEVIHAMNKF